MIDRLLQDYERGHISRRELLLALSALAAGAGSASALPRVPTQRELRGVELRQTVPFPARTLNHTTMFVANVERSVAFYQRLFGLPVQSRQENGINLRVGPQNQFLGIFQAATTTRPMLHHVCVGVANFDPARAVATLTENGVATGRIRMRGETAEVYFTDPDGLQIQIQDVSYCGGGGFLGNRC